MIGKDFIRSDQDPSQHRAGSALEIEPESAEQRRDTDGTDNPSHSLVKIDLYGQDRSEYIVTSLLTGLIQVPILINIHELLNKRAQVNSYEMGYGIALVQFITMVLYFWHKGLFFFDVPKEGRVLLLVRSGVFAVSFTLFLRSMSFLNPVTALMCQ